MVLAQNKSNDHQIHARQIAFVAAFLLPVSKFLEVPSILARFTAGDLLFPALLHLLVQSLILLTILYAACQSEKTLGERLRDTFGKGAIIFYLLFALYFLYAAALPLLDMEKYVYAAFFDTAPTTFSFGAFFLVSAYVCTKGIKAIGRSADLCLFLFLLPFLALIVMSLTDADFSNLLPFFGEDLRQSKLAFTYTAPHFSDAVLLMPLIFNLRYQKGDGKKIMTGYGVGAIFTLLFLAVFYAVFSSLAPREHYAFSKIAQYFPALKIVGRIDLIFIYLLSIVLILYTCLPLQYSTLLLGKSLNLSKKTILSAILNVLLFLFALFFNRRYNLFYHFISRETFLIFFLIADMLPLFLLFLPKNSGKTAKNNRPIKESVDA